MKKLEQLVLVFTMMLLFTAFFVDEVKAATIVDSGTCGTNAEWTLDDEGTLVISGTGVIEDYAFSSWSQIKSVTISEGVTSIGPYAFHDCRGLVSIEIPDSVTSIGDHAFYYCLGLMSIEIPDSVTSIGRCAFYDCRGLTSIEIPDGITSIEGGAFNGCYGLTSIEIPDSVTSIGEAAFANCDGLTSIEIPDSVTSIGDDAFADCDGLTSIEIPDSVTSIGDDAFFCCDGLTSIEIPDSVTSIGNRAFYECEGLTSIEIPDSVISIGDYAFYQCYGLTSIEISDSVTSIGDYVFYCCIRLTSIEIPDSVTSIGNRTFYCCYGLTSIKIPDSVTSIGDYAFYYCKGLTSIEIPDSVTSIGNKALADCAALCLYVAQGSYAEQYAIGYKLNYTYGELPEMEEAFSISASWQNITDTTSGKLTCKTGTNVELLITLKGTSDSDYKVEIYKTDGTLVKTLYAADFVTDNGLTYSFNTTFNVPGTEWYMIKYTGSDGSMKYVRSEQLVVRKADVVTQEQLDVLKSFAGVNVANFITGNVFVKQLDNGIIVDDIVYYEYLYDNGTDTYVSFFVKDTDKTLVTDYTILQKLWYVKAFRDKVINDAETIKSITASFDAVLDGLKTYELGGAASKLVGIGGSAYLTGGASFKASLAKGIADELTVEHFLELVVVAKFKDYQSFMQTLDKAVRSEKSGHRTELSDYDKIASYMCQLNSVASNYGSTFGLLKTLADIPDSNNSFLNWFSTFTDYFGEAINGLTFGLSDKLVDTVSKALVESLDGATDIYSCISSAYGIAFGEDITLESTDDIAGLIIECGTLIPGGDILDEVTLVSSNDWYGTLGNVIEYMLWAGQISQVEEEVADYRQTTSGLLEVALYTYDVIQKAAEGFVNPEVELVKGFGDRLIYTNTEYELEFAITGTVSKIVHSNNITVKATSKVNEGVTTEYVTITITQPLPMQNIWLKFISENDSSVKWESTIMVYETVDQDRARTIKYNSRTVGTDDEDKPLNDKKPQSSTQKAMTEIIEGLGGDDYIYPQYSGHSTNYLYYLDADNGHDTIYDYGGDDTIYIIGENADINKVNVSYNKLMWDIYYEDKLIITMDARIATQSLKDLKVAVAKEAEFRTGLFGSKSCIISGIETISIRLPRFMSVAYCPINAYVYDPDGKVIHVLKDGQESYVADGHGIFEVCYDETRGEYMKHVSLYDDEYSVKFMGNDEGVMEYQVTKAADDGSIVTYRKEEIAISKDIVLTVDSDNLAALTDSFGNTYEVEHVETIQCINPAEEETDGVVDFVNRMYRIILNREPDTDSQTWVDVLKDGSYTGAQVAEGFIMSNEFLARDMTNEEFVNIMYSVFFNREADETGLATWKGFLDENYIKKFVFAGFANSDEFKSLCVEYCIYAGEIELTLAESASGLSERDFNIWNFVERLYSEVLGRKPDTTGLDTWVGVLKDGSYTGTQVAAGFIMSDEFINKDMTNEEFVNIMYKAFFNRDADSVGLETWLNALETGWTKEEVFAGFANSTEFGTLCDSYGIVQGEIVVEASCN